MFKLKIAKLVLQKVNKNVGILFTLVRIACILVEVH